MQPGIIEIAIEPKSQADHQRLKAALAELAAEDPSFRVSTDPESGQIILKGISELQLDTKIDLMKRVPAPCHDSESKRAQRQRRHRSNGAADEHVRVHEWPARGRPGPRDLHHAIRSLRAGAAER